MVAPPHGDQAFCDESTIEPDQRRDIRNRAERDVMQHAEQVGLGHLAGPEAALAQLAVDRDQRHQHETDGGEMAEAREIVEPVRIDQRIDLRQLRAGLVMIDHDHGHAEALGFSERLDAGGAAIDRDEQRGALRGQRADRFGVRAVAFENPVGNMDQRIEPAMAQMPGEQRCRGGAVDVVVAEDRDLLAAHRCVRDPLRGGLHLRHGVRVRQQLADGRIEEVGDGVDIDTAARQHPCQ